MQLEVSTLAIAVCCLRLDRSLHNLRSGGDFLPPMPGGCPDQKSKGGDDTYDSAGGNTSGLVHEFDGVFSGWRPDSDLESVGRDDG